MKLNRFLLLGALLLLGVGLILGGCGKKDNPFTPNQNVGTQVNEGDMMGAGGVTLVSPPAAAPLMTDLNGTLADIQGEIVLTFPKYLDASTVNLTNISIDCQPTTGGVAYYPELMKVVITGTWTNSNAWHKITIKPGLRSVAGRPIDGNGNGKQDGSPYDDLVFVFGTGDTAAVGLVRPDLVHPVLTAMSPYGGGVGINPMLYVQFNANDVDTNLVKTSVTLRDSTGATRTLKSAGTNWNGTRLRCYFQPAPPDSPLVLDRYYTWSINLNTVQDTHNNKAVTNLWGYIANHPVMNCPFRTAGVPGTDYVPLHCTNAGGATITGNEVIITFDDSLDYRTASTSSIKLFKGTVGSFTGQIYGRVYYQPSDVAARQIRFTLENAPVSSGTYTVCLSRYLKDNAGLYLDGNGNGIGGEPGDPYWLGGMMPDDKYFTIIR